MAKTKEDLKDFLKKEAKYFSILTDNEKKMLQKNIKDEKILKILLSNARYRQIINEKKKFEYIMSLVKKDEKEKLINSLRLKSTYNEESKDEIYFLITDEEFESVFLIRKIYTITSKRHQITCKIDIKRIGKKIKQDTKRRLIYSFVKEFLFKEPKKLFEKTSLIEKFINYFLGIEKGSRGLIDFYRIMEDYNKIDDFDKFDYTLKFMNRFVLLFLMNSSGIVRSAVFDRYRKFPTTEDEEDKYSGFNLSDMLQNISPASIKEIFTYLNKKDENKFYHILDKKEYKDLQLVIPYLDSEIFAVFNESGNKEEKKFIEELFKRLQQDNNRRVLNEFIEFLGSFTWTVKETPKEEEELLGIDPEVLSALYEKIAIFFDVYKREKKKEKLDERKLREVLNQYIANKNKGVYFTPRVITEYITENTIIPWIKDRAEEKGIKLESENFEELKEELKGLVEKEKKDVLEIVRDVKILDPAVGSGGFLQPAGDILFEIRKILDKNFDAIKTAKEIVTHNLYGVDILPGAIEICKLRMWLWILSKANEIFEKEIINKEEYQKYTKELVLPNIEYNFRVGNSLIGFTELPKIDFSSDGIVKKLREIGIDTINSKKILEYRKKWTEEYRKGDLKNYEKLKKLEKILQDIFDDKFVYELANKLNKKKKLQIDKKEIKKLTPFHWVFEFPEVFLKENPGFDVVVGNPPYGNILSDSEKRIVKTIYPFKTAVTDSEGKGSHNAASIFIERSYTLLHKGANFGYIVPNSISRTEEFEKTRKFLLNNSYLYHIVDASNPFVGVTLEMIILFFKKRKIEIEKDYEISILSKRPNVSIKYNRVKRSVFEKYNQFMLYWDKIWEICNNNSTTLKTKLKEIISKKMSPKKTQNFYFPILKSGKGILRYTFIPKDNHFIYGDATILNNKYLNQEKIIIPTKLLALRGTFKPRNIGCYNNAKILLFDNIDINNLFLLLLLNSRLMDYLFRNYILNNSEFTMRVVPFYLNKLPIKLPSNQQPFIILADYMLFLNATEERRNSEKDMIEFIDKQIVDSLVYELYFKEKFYEDGLYPEPREYLLEEVSKHLKPINYDRWAELYWKKQLEGSLTQKEEKELNKLEKENIKIIKQLYNSLKNDPKIQKLIQKIKSHKWVKIIEEEK